MCASYLPPTKVSSIFNSSFFNYQDENVSFGDVVNLTNSQNIDGIKTFNQGIVLENGAQINGNVAQSSGNITTAGNLTVNGNATIGNSNADTCTVQAVTSFTNPALPTSTASSTTTANDLLNRTVADNRYTQPSSNNAWTGTNSFNSNLPTSSVTPSSASQLVTKTYVDSNFGG